MVPVKRKDLLTLLPHYSQIHQLWKAPSAATGISDVSGLGSLGFSAVSTLGQLAVGFSINPIIRESGADRLASSEPLDTQLRKSWT